MRKMKNYLKIGILLFGLILIMTNCETENEVMENPITIEKEFIIKQYHFKDLSSNFKFQKAIEKLNSKNSKSIYSNKSTDDIYNFTIDSTRIKEVIKGNYTSYTLLINRPFKTSEYFENLVIEIKENETINAFIIKYILSSPIKIFEEHNSFSFQANFTIVSLDINNINLSSKSTTDDCSPIAQTWCNWSYPHIAGPSCYEANDGRLFTVLAENPNCTENGDPSSGGGGGGGTTGSDPDPIYTSPINPDGTPVEFPTTASSSEGSDQLEFDPHFWSNTNLIFPQQNKPSFADFFNAYPKAKYNGAMAANDVFILIGGNVNSMAIENSWTNACAARVSRALNYSGVQIPNIPGLTFEGGDGKYYFLGANNLYNWMKKTFGEPDFSLNSDECGENGDGFIQSVNGHSGIYIMLPVNSTLFGATGHSDIYSGFGFNIQGYFNATGGLKSANLWSLN